MTKTQSVQHGKRKHILQLRRNRYNKTTRIQRLREDSSAKRKVTPLPVAPLPVRPALPSPVWKADKRKGYVLVGLLIALVATLVAINLLSA